jgi:dolichol-phosphate mannosyltransferase
MLVSPTHTRIVIPTYNERSNLPLIVRRVMDETRYSILIVDDNSPDGTGRIADELATEYLDRVTVLHRTGPRGLGRSYVDGMRQALALGAERICQMDADLSHGPEYLDALVAAADHADVAVGSRYATGVSVANWPLRRLLLSLVANHYVRIVTRLPVRDTTSGFKCWRRDALIEVLDRPLHSEGYALQFEMLFHAYRAGRHIVEVPIVFVERRDGASKMSGRVIFESMLRPIRLVLSRAPNRSTRRAPLDDTTRRPLATELPAGHSATTAAEHRR